MFKWKFPNPFGRKSRKNITKKIVLGICAMDKKAKSKPMREILDRLPSDLFEIKIFGDECILNEPIESWPVVEVLITFYSTKFPTEKALEYIKLRKPFLINDLSMESTLQDRRKVYNLLEQFGIDVPRHIFVSRDESTEDTYEIEEFDEYIVINGEQLNKPFVEKPVYAEDHNIYIYYPISAGGGSKRLFRKVNDKSAEFYPHINEIRREGSYIYEEFVTTQGTDVKVYTVGAEYGHAEARKSPVVDGRVKRDSEGREVRYPVILSPIEKEMARKIVQAFRQTVCGFDILRVQGKSYCCDVNGFSFVKNSRKYYEDASQILTEIMLNNLRQEYQIPPSVQTRRVPSPALNQNVPNSAKAIRQREASVAQSDVGGFTPSMVAVDEVSSSVHGGNRPPSPSPSIISEFEYGNPIVYSANQRRYETEELRSVIAIIRHGDRTPKQKIKVVISEQRYLDYFHSYVKTPKKDLKVKSKSGLVTFLEVTREIIQDRNTPNELRRKLIQLRDVLERWEISGINRKLQMKPQKWDEDEFVEVEEWVEMDDTEGMDGNTTDGEGNLSGFVLSREHSNTIITTPGMNSNASVLPPTSPSSVQVHVGETSVLQENEAISPTPAENSQPSFSSPDLSISQQAATNAAELEESGYLLGGTACTTPSSTNKQFRRRQLVKTKKLVREGTGQAVEILVILKWGGDLTPLGREQAEKLGERFRNENYPDHDNGGVLRLHATYRHDLKIKASDEGRVMKTAAAFTKGLLELEGQLTPILASLVTIEEKNRTMLDRGGNFEMKEEMDRCKKHLNLLQVDQEVTDELIEQIVPGCCEVTRQAFHDLGNPLEKLRRMHYLIDKICTQLEFLCARREESGIGLDDSMVMTDYILPASGHADANAPSPLALNMVGMNMPEVAQVAPTPTPPAPAAAVVDNGSSPAVVVSNETDIPLNASAPPQMDVPIIDEQLSSTDLPPTTDTQGNNTKNSIASGANTANTFAAAGQSVPSTATTSAPSGIGGQQQGALESTEDLSFMNTLYLNETFDLMLERWKKLHKDFYSSKTSQYDLTKLPDVYDMIRYDSLHNQHLNFTGMDELYELAKKFELVVVPQEYGIDAADKRYIGSKMCGALIEKIKHDLTIASGVDSGLNNQDPMLFQLDHSHAEDMRINSIGRVVRTRLYFTSESHLHTILNVFRYPKPNSSFSFGKEAMEKLEQITNVSYLSQIVIRLFEDRIERGKFSCELSFSSGSTQHDPVVLSTTTLPLNSPYLLAPYVYLDKSLNLYQLLGCLDDAIELYHNTDKHTTNAMLVAASNGQSSVQRLTPTPSEDVQDDGEGGLLRRRKSKTKVVDDDNPEDDACCCTEEEEGGEGNYDAQDSTVEEGKSTMMTAGQQGERSVTPPPTHLNASAANSLNRRSLSSANKHHYHHSESIREEREIVDCDPEPIIDSVHSTPVKSMSTRLHSKKLCVPSTTDNDSNLDDGQQKQRPSLSTEKSQKSGKNINNHTLQHQTSNNFSKVVVDDLIASPLPMRRNYSVTVNIDEASDNWERLEKSLLTTNAYRNQFYHHHHHLTAGSNAHVRGAAVGMNNNNHASSGIAGSSGGSGSGSGSNTGGTATSISRSRQQEIDLLTRRAVASQLQFQQQQQFQLNNNNNNNNNQNQNQNHTPSQPTAQPHHSTHSVFQGSPSTFATDSSIITAATAAAAAVATAASSNSSSSSSGTGEPTSPLRVPAKRAVSLGSQDVDVTVTPPLSASALYSLTNTDHHQSTNAGNSGKKTEETEGKKDGNGTVAPVAAVSTAEAVPATPAIAAELPLAVSSETTSGHHTHGSSNAAGSTLPPPAPVNYSPSAAGSNSTAVNAGTLAGSRKRTGSLSADNIVLLDRERERATSELGLVSDSRVLSSTPTAMSSSSSAAVMIIENNHLEGTLTVVKPTSSSSSSSSTAPPVNTSSNGSDVSLSAATATNSASISASNGSESGVGIGGGGSVSVTDSAPVTAAAAVETCAAATTTTNSNTNNNGASNNSNNGTSDVIVVQRSLSDIENRRLKDSLFLASDFYVPPSPTVPTVTASSNSNNTAKQGEENASGK